jgi:hypothetical protein
MLCDCRGALDNGHCEHRNVHARLNAEWAALAADKMEQPDDASRLKPHVEVQEVHTDPVVGAC